MARTPINESMKVHDEWYKTAKSITIDTLPEFMEHLMRDYIHDYGTICHALAAGAIAAATALDSEPEGGITGFQASAIMWEFITHWNHESNKCGMRLIDYDNFLYPQYADKFQKVISQDVWNSLQTQAKTNIELSDGHVHPNVLAHWQSIVDGKVPFGYTIGG